MASVYAPISYGPLPFLAFKVPLPAPAPDQDPGAAEEASPMVAVAAPSAGDMGGARLVAAGTVRSCDPDRVILKKITLTGTAGRGGGGRSCSTTPGPSTLELYLLRPSSTPPLFLPSFFMPSQRLDIPPHPKRTRAGWPVRVHKRRATVKFMFHTPDDIRWFRSVQTRGDAGYEGAGRVYS